MKITRGQLRRIIRETAHDLNEGAMPAAGRWGQRIEAVRDQLATLGERVSKVWDEVGDVDMSDVSEMLDTDFDIEAFNDQLNAIDDQLTELMIALYEVDS